MKRRTASRRTRAKAMVSRAMPALGGLRIPSRGPSMRARRRPRTRGMFLRKGRLFLGFAQKEIKAAMRRAYGGRRGKK